MSVMRIQPRPGTETAPESSARLHGSVGPCSQGRNASRLVSRRSGRDSPHRTECPGTPKPAKSDIPRPGTETAPERSARLHEGSRPLLSGEKLLQGGFHSVGVPGRLAPRRPSQVDRAGSPRTTRPGSRAERGSSDPPTGMHQQRGRATRTQVMQRPALCRGVRSLGRHGAAAGTLPRRRARGGPRTSRTRIVHGATCPETGIAPRDQHASAAAQAGCLLMQDPDPRVADKVLGDA